LEGKKYGGGEKKGEPHEMKPCTEERQIENKSSAAGTGGGKGKGGGDYDLIKGMSTRGWGRDRSWKKEDTGLVREKVL